MTMTKKMLLVYWLTVPMVLIPNLAIRKLNSLGEGFSHLTLPTGRTGFRLRAFLSSFDGP